MLEKIRSILPIVALVVMMLGVSYITALDNKKTAEVRSSNGQYTENYQNK